MYPMLLKAQFRGYVGRGFCQYQSSAFGLCDMKWEVHFAPTATARTRLNRSCRCIRGAWASGASYHPSQLRGFRYSSQSQSFDISEYDGNEHVYISVQKAKLSLLR